MIMFQRSAFWGLPLIALTACSSSTERPVTFVEGVQRFSSLAEEIDGLPFTDPTTLPTSGRATYNGVMGLIVDEGAADEMVLLGDMSMTADFQTNALTGQVTDVVDSSDKNYSGTLTISDGLIDDSTDPAIEPTFIADLSGNLNDPDGGAYSVNAAIGGLFVAGDYSHVAGIVVGDITTPDALLEINGSFIAAR